MTGRVLYKSSVSKDLKHVDLRDRERILRRVEAVLRENPRRGEGLQGEFEGLCKLRVGDYRVVYALVGADAIILRIRHRSKSYD